jgi:hypothetical protein
MLPIGSDSCSCTPEMGMRFTREPNIHPAKESSAGSPIVIG